MARSYAQLHTSIWQDKDFCALPAFAQRVYLLLISQPTVSYAGVLAYTERRFAAMAGDTSKGEIAEAMCVLEDADYIVTDDDTEEVWVRSWSRYNGVLDHPNLRKAMVAAYDDVLSPGIRAAVFSEYGSDEKLLLTTPAEPDANPTRRQREPDESASVQVTSREDLDLDLLGNQQGGTSPDEWPLVDVQALIAPTMKPEWLPEVDTLVMALVDTYGNKLVESAIGRCIADRLRFERPSDLRRALQQRLGPPPAEAKPNVLDEAQRAQRAMAERDQAAWRNQLDAYQEPSEDERARVKALLKKESA